MKKHDWGNTVIEVLNKEHGKRVRTFWLKVFQENNEKINNYGFDHSMKNGDNDRYYGYIDGTFNNYYMPDLSLDSTILSLEQAEEIYAKEQQPELSFPREMIVSDDHDFSSNSIEIVYGIFNDREDGYPVIGKTNIWRFAKEIPIEQEVIKITLNEAKKELAELHNCTVDQLTIIF